MIKCPVSYFSWAITCSPLFFSTHMHTFFFLPWFSLSIYWSFPQLKSGYLFQRKTLISLADKNPHGFFYVFDSWALPPSSHLNSFYFHPFYQWWSIRLYPWHGYCCQANPFVWPPNYLSCFNHYPLLIMSYLANQSWEALRLHSTILILALVKEGDEIHVSQKTMKSCY